jgi:hypothetical protein
MSMHVVGLTGHTMVCGPRLLTHRVGRKNDGLTAILHVLGVMEGRCNRYDISNAILVSADLGINKNYCLEPGDSLNCSNPSQLITSTLPRATSGDLRHFALTSDTSYIHVTESKLKYLGTAAPDQKMSGQKASKWCSGIAGLILGCFGAADSRAARVFVELQTDQPSM